MTEMLAGALPGRDIHVVADSAYAGGELKKLPPQVTWTTRLRKDAALHGLPPQRTGKRGRPRQKGDRLPALAGLAATAAFTEVTVTRYGKTAAISAAAVTCLWPTVFGTRAVTVVLIRDRSAASYDLALVTTDTAAAAQVIERYASKSLFRCPCRHMRPGRAIRASSSRWIRHRCSQHQARLSGEAGSNPAGNRAGDPCIWTIGQPAPEGSRALRRVTITPVAAVTTSGALKALRRDAAD
jgi:hypothetical protein